ncbi:ATP/GTP-binding protein [Streptomyces brasiliensis]|uniref:ATP/GTP-binding protein n=1 Tax=Streptomyces brasiliensis TaxID=1954 RepID=A0A917P433_9ACTN|nr:ATP/GTP-binding protein [Streptomyces brasiliensis]GGJ60673.1 ATP/GTP-binding protein [Streptomyces brasiliensis]
MLTRHAIATAIACALVVAGTTSAYAGEDPDISKGNCDLMSFCVGVGDKDRTGGRRGQHLGSEHNAFTGNSKPSDCSVRAMDPQPPPGSKYHREGKTVYERVCSVEGQDGLVDITFVGTDPGQNAPAMDPQVVAHQAVDKMLLAGPDIASPRADGKYTVGVPMWMWVNQSATTYGPNTASASAGGITVTATAKVSKIVWQMGDGSSVTCNGPGTPYQASEGMAQSPTCGHVYSKTSAGAKSGKYQVTATSTWTIDWQGGGAAGQLTEIRQTNVQVAIGELQVVR